MKTKILSFLLFALLPGAASAAEAKITAISGSVEVRQSREGKWTSASENMEIAEGGAIRTGAGGSAVLLMPNKTKVWLKESSSLDIEQRQTLASRLSLAFGKIKLRVPHLMRKEKFEVRTPSAVCAVRGTEFTMETTPEGKMNIQVLFGEVKLKFTVPSEKGRSEFSIPQGQGLNLEEKGKTGTVALLDPKTEKAALENWNPGLKPEERQQEMKQKENDREQVREFAKTTNNAEKAVNNFLNVVKESDLEAGRTLNDIHGNLVRVDQRMMRPEPNEIQFFNLVKRPVYNNNNASVSKGGFRYNGGQVSDRLDYMQMTMAFNRNLPQRIEEWPSFFNGSSVDPSWASFVTANRTDSGEIFFISQGSRYDGNDLINDPSVVGVSVTAGVNDRNVIVTGILKNETGVTALDGLNRISRLRVMDAGANDGTLKYADNTAVNGAGGTNVLWAIKTEDAHSYSEPDSIPDNAPIAQFQADMYDVGDKHNSYMWLASENYVIGNGGQVRRASDFTDTSSDPFTLLKSNALENVMYIKKSNGVANAALPDTITSSSLALADINKTGNGDYFSYGGGASGVGTNIDIVFIPDLLVAAVQRMLPALTNMED